MNSPTPTDTLSERLERRMGKRVECGDYRVCAAHDLAPVFERVFGVETKALARDGEFLATLRRLGLGLKDSDGWKVLRRGLFGRERGRGRIVRSNRDEKFKYSALNE